MSEFFIYLIKVAIVFSLLLLPFLATRKTKYFTVNRFYLLGIMIFSLLLPFLKWESPLTVPARISYVLNTFEVNTVSDTGNSAPGFGVFTLLSVLYFTVAVFFLARFLYTLLKLTSIIRKSKKIGKPGYTIVFIRENNAFSFFRFLFINSVDTDPRIIGHEKVHIHQWHSADIIFTELYLIINWMNPLVYFLKNEIKQIHEYIADEKVIREYDRKNYNELILSSALSSSSPSLSHSFNTSTLKNRIIMMKKKNRSKTVLLTLAAALPIAVFSSALLSGNSGIPAFFQTPPLTIQDDANPVPEDKNETVPQFVGGDEAFAKFLSENIKYPESAKKNNKAGMVYVSFIVDKNGKVKNAAVKRGFDTDCDNEALRVISMMPDWKPGTAKGKPVDSEMVLPVKFSL